MTVLAVIQSAANVLGVGRPDAVFGSGEEEHVQLADALNQAASDIAERHEWHLLKRLHTITGNGETDAYDLPPDYDRMPKGQGVWSSRLSCVMEHVTAHDEWLGRLVQDYQTGIGSWTLLGGQIVFYPALADGETAKLYYMSNLIATDLDSVTKAAFTADDDDFRLDERLLRAGLVWTWKKNRGRDYGQDFADFEAMLAMRVAEDGGPRTIRIGSARAMPDAVVAYPKAIIG